MPDPRLRLLAVEFEQRPPHSPQGSMLPTRSVKQPPRRRSKPYVRRPPSIPRSGSILSTIRNIVTAPLSWFAANEEFEDINGKRRKMVDLDQPPEGYSEGSRSKKMRVHSPPRNAGYLDPPEVAFQPPCPSVQAKSVALEMNGKTINRGSARRISPLTLTRTMSIDPPSRKATLGIDFDFDFDNSLLPRKSSMGLRKSMSTPRDISMLPPPAPFRMRTSLTPQPSPTKPLRREVSAPPPLARLMSNPVFVKPPIERPVARQTEEQKTIPLGSFAEFQRTDRSVSRDQGTDAVGSLNSLSIPLSYHDNVRLLNAAEKTLHNLEIYKSPIVPSRYRGSSAIPQFLKPRRAHVPIPMTSKDRDIKPSLGMREKVARIEKADGKPYAGQGGLSKLLARRRAEEEEEQMINAMEDDDSSKRTNKRDIGISVKINSDTEEERVKRFQSNDVLPLSDNVPLANGREKLSGRVGRARTSHRESPWRSYLSGGGQRTRNKFSASFDDDGSEDQWMADEADVPVAKSSVQAEDVQQQEGAKTSSLEVPVGFSFANDTSPIEHDHDGAKEPPITALPFSFGNASSQSSTKTSNVTSTQPVTFLDKESFVPSHPFGTPVSDHRLTPTSETISSATSALDREIRTSMPPKLNISPPTPPEQSPRLDRSEISSNASTDRVLADAIVPSNTASGKVPNFFANSPFLACASTPNPPILPPTSSSVPLKDAENPLWDGDQTEVANAAAVVASNLVRPKTTESKPVPFGGFSRPSSLGRGSGLSENGAKSVPFLGSTPEEIEINSSSSVSDDTLNAAHLFTKASQSSFVAGADRLSPAASNASASFVDGKPDASNVSTSASNGAAKSSPLFNFTPTPPPSAGGVEAQGSTFAFNVPPSRADGNSTVSTFPAHTTKPLFGSGAGFSFSSGSTPAGTSSNADADKSPFAFGAPPSTPPTLSEKKDSTSSFGAPTGTNSAFNFGPPVSGTGTSNVGFTGTPFAFGVPGRPSTPPAQDDKEVRMEESPTRDMNGKPSSDIKPSGDFFFNGANGTSFGQSSSGTSNFVFGGQSSLSTFQPKPETKPAGFAFGRTTSAPVVSTCFSFGQEASDNTVSPGFGSQASPFAQTSASASPFSFGNPTPSNPFAQSTQTNSPTPNSPSQFQASPSFSFSAPSGLPNNPFNFGASQPSSPANTASVLPQSPAASSAPFTFGQPSSSQQTPSSPFGAPSGGALFNIGAPPPATTSNSNNAPRQVKKLPRRGMAGKR